jgi:hypothetical protein
MQRRLGSRLQKGILDCLGDERVDSSPGIKIRPTSTVIEYLFEEGYIKRPDKRRKNYEEKCRLIYIKVCRVIRNLARDELDKGIKPIIRVGRSKGIDLKKWTHTYRVGHRRKITEEFYGSKWFQYIYPADFKLSEEKH